mmetsp:Transcript_23438/g.46197  ORF Transcript_23438/g.46197 Transcript_23438/m.46197 type:complete len:210 (-) Transcript_23438:299-928(-)
MTSKWLRKRTRNMSPSLSPPLLPLHQVTLHLPVAALLLQAELHRLLRAHLLRTLPLLPIAPRASLIRLRQDLLLLAHPPPHQLPLLLLHPLLHQVLPLLLLHPLLHQVLLLPLAHLPPQRLPRLLDRQVHQDHRLPRLLPLLLVHLPLLVPLLLLDHPFLAVPGEVVCLVLFKPAEPSRKVPLTLQEPLILKTTSLRPSEGLGVELAVA